MEDLQQYIIKNFWFGLTVGVMFGIILCLLAFGSPLHELCGTEACIKTIMEK